MKALVTGGAGFIGSHLVDGLLAEGWEVRILDNLDPQVHGSGQRTPDYLARDAELQIGDMRDPTAVAAALDGVDAVFHEAAAVGVGQSMYEIVRYVETNSLGAAVLLQAVVERRDRIRKLVVASSMSVYGEGAYQDRSGRSVYPKTRPPEQLAAHRWELLGPDGEPLTPVPTPESKPLYPSSVYAVTKRDHEELFLVVGAAYDIPVVALRYFNTYGPRQALTNPYTGLLAIVRSELMNGHRPVIFEDGLQARDFVHVSDVVQANLCALRSERTEGQIYNVGTGNASTVLDVVALLSRRFDFAEPPKVTGRYRAGDIRHCFADIGLIGAELGYRPRVALEQGLNDLIPWIERQHSTDKLTAAISDLEHRALIH